MTEDVLVPGVAETPARQESPRRSVAILVDDLATWLVAGLQPTGIQRVVSELLDTAYARPDIRGWPAVTIGGLDADEMPGLVEVSPDSLRWETHQGGARAKLRLLKVARRMIVRLRIPRRTRRAAKSVYARLALRYGGIRALNVAARASPEALLVPGGFWSGDSAGRIRRLAGRGVPVRLIVYDLFPVRNPEWCVPELCREFEEALDALAPICDRIVTLSQEVANQVAERYPASAGRITFALPTLEAHAPRWEASAGGSPVALGGPFVLALSTVEPRKNHRVILDAWRLVRQDARTGDARLVIAGRRGWKTDDIEAEIATSAQRLGIVRLGNATDQMVEALYRDCLATIHASWAEGFGLPVRESVARGIPTLMSSTIPRDGLPHGTYRTFDPTDAQGLADLMVDAIAAGHVRTPVVLGQGTGWEPVLSALVD